MQTWKYRYKDMNIEVTSDDKLIIVLVDGIAVANGDVCAGYTKILATLEDSTSIIATVGTAVPGGCKVRVAGEMLNPI